MAQFEEERLDNWKQFHGTELGSLLSGLYGGNKPQIKYPKIKRREVIEESKMFRPVCNKPNAFDPTNSTRRQDREKSLAVPRVHGRRASTDNLDDENVLPIHYISRRKSGNMIMKELEDIKMKQTYYRPAYVQPFSSDAEKDRLSQICEHKGGKALPSELIAPSSEAPFERAARKLGDEKMNEFRMRRGLSVLGDNHGSSSSVSGKKTLISAHEQLLEQITGEIQERQNYIDSMRGSNSFSKSEETQIKSEIAQRLNELKKLEKSV